MLGLKSRLQKRLLRKVCLNAMKSPFSHLEKGDFFIHINPANQSLTLKSSSKQNSLKSFIVSTAKNGLGEQNGSLKTPRGWHIVRAKIGQNEPQGAVFVGRRPTGEIFSPELFSKFPNRDWILTRILWLSGLEIGNNRLKDVDTMRRYIYIHGGPDNDINGSRSSHGCIKMKNNDIIELFEIVPIYTKVFIGEDIVG